MSIMTPPRVAVNFKSLRAEHCLALDDFFAALVASGAERFFHPHPLDATHAKKIATYDGADFYGAAFYGEKIVSYGMLRGWDEMFVVPRLGLAVHPEWQGRGIGRQTMNYLHHEARLRRAPSVRLSVDPANHSAIQLYRSFGYQLTAESPELIVGTLPFAL
jgi:ribosomal protein S18 acetylase RimI-like enzyme